MKRLCARDLSVFAPGAREPVVRDIHLEVDPGEWITIAGPNGCGKTSLMLGLAGLWPSTGHLELDGRALAGGDPSLWRRAVGVVFQDPASQLLHSTVFDEIAFAPRNLGLSEREIRARVERCSSRLGLSAELDADPSRLSAGRQQLVVLAAALATEPDLVLADEVTTHLDLFGVERVITTLREELARGAALVTVAGRAAEFEQAHRVLALHEGGHVAIPEGSSRSESYAQPGSASTALGLGSDRAAARAQVVVAPLEGSGSGPVVRTASRVEIELPACGALALVGANGAGKSVILGAIAGFVTCPQVEVRWLEKPQVAAIMTLQYPEQQLFEDRVADEVTYAAIARGRPRESALQSARALLSGLGLDPGYFLGRRVWDLSGGQRRLVQLVAALAAPASVYLLDEPTAGLDLDHKTRLSRVIDQVAQDTPVVIATQDVGWVFSLKARSIPIGEFSVTKWHQRLKNPLTPG